MKFLLSFLLLPFWSFCQQNNQVTSGNNKVKPAVLVASSKEMSSLTQEVATISKNIADIREVIKSSMSEMSIHSKSRTALLQKKTQVRHELDGMVESTDYNKKDELEKQLKNLDQQIAVIDKKINALTNFISKQTKEIEKLNESIDKLKEKMKQLEAKEKNEQKSRKEPSSSGEEAAMLYARIRLLADSIGENQLSTLPSTAKQTLTIYKEKFQNDPGFRQLSQSYFSQSELLEQMVEDEKKSYEDAKELFKNALKIMQQYLERMALLQKNL